MRQITSLHRPTAASSTEFSVPAAVTNSKGKKLPLEKSYPRNFFLFIVWTRTTQFPTQLRSGWLFFFFSCACIWRGWVGNIDQRQWNTWILITHIYGCCSLDHMSYSSRSYLPSHVYRWHYVPRPPKSSTLSMATEWWQKERTVKAKAWKANKQRARCMRKICEWARAL